MRTLLKTLGVCLLIAGSAHAAEHPLRVVATLSTFADLAKTIGGEHVEVSTIASPRFNPHFIEPKPSDVRKVKRAELFVHAGLDLEAWRGPLLDAAGNRDVMAGGDRELDLSQGIALLEVPMKTPSRAEGDIHLYGNPHYWTDPRNGAIMAQTICDKLCAVDPDHCPGYRQNLDAFRSRLDAQLARWHADAAPLRGQEVVGYHNEWVYLTEWLGLRMTQFLEPKPGIPPTPKQLGFLQEYIQRQQVRAIIRASYFPPASAATLAKRTGAQAVMLCQNVDELPSCSDYIAMVDYNVTTLANAFQSAEALHE